MSDVSELERDLKLLRLTKIYWAAAFVLFLVGSPFGLWFALIIAGDIALFAIRPATGTIGGDK